MRYPIYNNYDEIPKLVADYILRTANTSRLEMLSLENINSFLDFLDEREKENLLYFPKRISY